MECIKYINDLEIKIKVLEELKGHVDNEIELEKEIKEKKDLLNQCKENLKKLSDDDICYRIYVYMLEGLNATKAIEKVAEENYLNDKKPTTTTAIWTIYYPKLKKNIKNF